MPNCCGGASCACKINAGEGIGISGSGSTQDPFVVTSEREFTVADNSVFNLTITGQGTAADPWVMTVQYAATAKLDDIPDVNAPTPPNGYVLTWQTSSSTWIASPPTTAPTGAVSHDNSLQGDGSVGAPLNVKTDTARGIQTTVDGVGLTDSAINQLNRKFSDAVARETALPAPDTNTLSTLVSDPGRVDYFDGTTWRPVKGDYNRLVIGGEFLALSGSYDGEGRLTQIIKQINTNSDGVGMFDLLDPTDLAGFGGVLSIAFQETGEVAFQAMPFANTDRVSSLAYFTSDGSLFAGLPITGTLLAWAY